MLKALRLHKQLTQAQLATRAQISQAYVAYLEQGEKTNPSLVVVRRIAKALGTTSGAVIDALSGRTKGGPR